MELLYFIDKHLTAFIQRTYGSLHYLLQLVMEMLIYLVLANTGDLLGPQMEVSSAEWLYVMIACIALCIVVPPTIAVLLRLIHEWVDPEVAFDVEKEFDDGYLAWGALIFGLTLYTSYWIIFSYFATNFLGAVVLGMLVPKAFNRRRRRPPKKRKTVVVEALKRLLDRIKARQGQAMPIPVPIRLTLRQYIGLLLR